MSETCARVGKGKEGEGRGGGGEIVEIERVIHRTMDLRMHARTFPSSLVFEEDRLAQTMRHRFSFHGSFSQFDVLSWDSHGTSHELSRLGYTRAPTRCTRNGGGMCSGLRAREASWAVADFPSVTNGSSTHGRLVHSGSHVLGWKRQWYPLRGLR